MGNDPHLFYSGTITMVKPHINETKFYDPTDFSIRVSKRPVFNFKSMVNAQGIPMEQFTTVTLDLAIKPSNTEMDLVDIKNKAHIWLTQHTRPDVFTRFWFDNYYYKIVSIVKFDTTSTNNMAYSGGLSASVSVVMSTYKYRDINIRAVSPPKDEEIYIDQGKADLDLTLGNPNNKTPRTEEEWKKLNTPNPAFLKTLTKVVDMTGYYYKSTPLSEIDFYDYEGNKLDHIYVDKDQYSILGVYTINKKPIPVVNSSREVYAFMTSSGIDIDIYNIRADDEEVLGYIPEEDNIPEPPPLPDFDIGHSSEIMVSQPLTLTTFPEVNLKDGEYQTVSIYATGKTPNLDNVRNVQYRDINNLDISPDDNFSEPIVEPEETNTPEPTMKWDKIKLKETKNHPLDLFQYQDESVPTFKTKTTIMRQYHGVGYKFTEEIETSENVKKVLNTWYDSFEDDKKVYYDTIEPYMLKKFEEDNELLSNVKKDISQKTKDIRYYLSGHKNNISAESIVDKWYAERKKIYDRAISKVRKSKEADQMGIENHKKTIEDLRKKPISDKSTQEDWDRRSMITDQSDPEYMTDEYIEKNPRPITQEDLDGQIDSIEDTINSLEDKIKNHDKMVDKVVERRNKLNKNDINVTHLGLFTKVEWDREIRMYSNYIVEIRNGIYFDISHLGYDHPNKYDPVGTNEIMKRISPPPFRIIDPPDYEILKNYRKPQKIKRKIIEPDEPEELLEYLDEMEDQIEDIKEGEKYKYELYTIPYLFKLDVNTKYNHIGINYLTHTTAVELISALVSERKTTYSDMESIKTPQGSYELETFKTWMINSGYAYDRKIQTDQPFELPTLAVNERKTQLVISSKYMLDNHPEYSYLGGKDISDFRKSDVKQIADITGIDFSKYTNGFDYKELKEVMLDRGILIYTIPQNDTVIDPKTYTPDEHESFVAMYEGDNGEWVEASYDEEIEDNRRVRMYLVKKKHYLNTGVLPTNDKYAIHRKYKPDGTFEEENFIKQWVGVDLETVPKEIRNALVTWTIMYYYGKHPYRNEFTDRISSFPYNPNKNDNYYSKYFLEEGRNTAPFIHEYNFQTMVDYLGMAGWSKVIDRFVEEGVWSETKELVFIDEITKREWDEWKEEERQANEEALRKYYEKKAEADGGSASKKTGIPEDEIPKDEQEVLKAMFDSGIKDVSQLAKDSGLPSDMVDNFVNKYGKKLEDSMLQHSDSGLSPQAFVRSATTYGTNHYTTYATQYHLSINRSQVLDTLVPQNLSRSLNTYIDSRYSTEPLRMYPWSPSGEFTPNVTTILSAIFTEVL